MPLWALLTLIVCSLALGAAAGIRILEAAVTYEIERGNIDVFIKGISQDRFKL